MRAAISTLEVARPRHLAHALSLLHDSLAGERMTPLAGGTDLFVYLNAGTHEGRSFLDLAGLRDLRGVRVGKAGARIGALATFRELGRHAQIRERWPALAAASGVVGAAQIQNRATLAGNIANASPAGDSLPVLFAYDAIVHARSVRGARAIPFAELYRGYRELALEPDELVTGVELPLPPPRAFAFFRKVGTRVAQSISKVVMAGAIRTAKDGTVDHVRLAWGSVAPTPIRAAAAEAALLGARPSAAAARAARAALASDIAPIDDIRSNREYRLEVAANVLDQFLRAAHPRFTR